MVIAVNFQVLSNPLLNNNTRFVFECFAILAKQYPQHQFIYIVDKGFDEKYISAKNIIPVVAGPQIKNPLLLQYRLNYKVPSILRKYKADVFICNGCSSLRTKVPQCVIINDLSFLHHTKFFPANWLRFYKNNTAKFLHKAKSIVSNSQSLKQEIIDRYTIDNNKIIVGYHGVNKKFKPISWQEKEQVKERYSEGKEYFLYSGAIHPAQDLTALLKAFSFFKKRQKSNMQLVIASATTAMDKDFIKSLASFKYRNEIKLFENISVDEQVTITAGAYALVYPSTHTGFAASLMETMQSEVPVITGHTVALAEICNEAALYINPGDFNDIADKMMLLFKDEDKRNELIAKGSKQATLYNWDKTAGMVWEAIVKCADMPR